MNDEGYQEVSIYLDDSGVFSARHHNNFFIYAGYVFLNEQDRIDARTAFKAASKEIKEYLNIPLINELKAAGLEFKYKRSLYNCVKRFDSLSAVVDLRTVKAFIMEDKLSIHRYKDYVLKRSIKAKLESLIASGKIYADRPVYLRVYIDQQHTSTNGYYTLAGSIREELIHGVRNFNYGVFYPPILFADFKMQIQFCDSAHDYLVQASDILANRLWTGYNFDAPHLYKNIPSHKSISLP